MMRWFDAAGVRAAIIGGVAASLLGKPRLTRDIDAVVMDAEAETLIESGAPYGFQPQTTDTRPASWSGGLSAHRALAKSVPSATAGYEPG